MEQSGHQSKTYCKYMRDEFFELLDAAILRNMPEGQASVDFLSGQLHMSTSQFLRMVKRHTGRTAVAYVTDVRLREARRLLRLYPQHTVAEVAQQCGFADVSHFSHVFRRVTGTSPSQYIKAHSRPVRTRKLLK